jgi:Group II intron, maturase-specific domain
MRVRELTQRTRGKSLAKIMEELSRYLIGWRNYFGLCQTRIVLSKLDGWIRERYASFPGAMEEQWTLSHYYLKGSTFGWSRLHCTMSPRFARPGVNGD